MKEHEKIFFALCYNLCPRLPDLNVKEGILPRQIINALAGTIPCKRCWYYLDKWARRGFYSYGVTLDMGWFWEDKIPPEYLKIINEEAVEE